MKLFDSLYQGIHFIVVKDELNCLDTLSFVVDEPDPMFELTIDLYFVVPQLLIEVQVQISAL